MDTRLRKYKYHQRLKDGFAQEKERRHFIRHQLCLPLSYKVIKPGGAGQSRQEERSETINVSSGGLLFPAKEPVKTDSLIAIRMPFQDKVFNIKAKVVRCLNNPETKLYDVAVKFPKRHEGFKVKMIEQVYSISEYRNLLSLQTGKKISFEEASRKWIKRYSERFKKLYW